MKSLRRGATSNFNSRDISVIQTLNSTSRPFLSIKRDMTDTHCHQYQIQSLRQDFQEYARACGICSNTKPTAPELQEFQVSYQKLCLTHSEGLTKKEFVTSMLDHHLFSCKNDALMLWKLLPKTQRGYVTAQSIIEASSDITIHQRRKLIKFIKLLPIQELNQSRSRPNSR